MQTFKLFSKMEPTLPKIEEINFFGPHKIKAAPRLISNPT